MIRYITMLYMRLVLTAQYGYQLWRFRKWSRACVQAGFETQDVVDWKAAQADDNPWWYRTIAYRDLADDLQDRWNARIERQERKL